MLGEQHCLDRLHPVHRKLSGTVPKETEKVEAEQNYMISSLSIAEKPPNELIAPFIDLNDVHLVKLNHEHDASKKSTISFDSRRW
jgi:hypothetical protein